MTTLVHEIPYQDPVNIFSLFADKPWSIFLDSAQLTHLLSRYSFIAIDPFATLTSKQGKINFNEQIISDDPFRFLKKLLSKFPSTINSQSYPPFQGGAVGYFGYELCYQLEKIPFHAFDDLNAPDMALGFYDLVLAFDHSLKQAWIFSSGYPEMEYKLQQIRARERCDWLLQQLSTTIVLQSSDLFIQPNNIAANFNEFSYQHAIDKIKEYIFAGDVYQVNLSQRFSAKISKELTAFEIYQRLRKINPAPFSAYLKLTDFAIVSASPERFLQVENNRVMTHPIKGTRPRGKTLAEDRLLSEELTKSTKDMAENLMIVDLMRNDLAKVCRLNSIFVPKLFELQSYATVHHLVSTIVGELAAQYDAVDLLQATFPGGSVTGAPKIRAMQIIAELEPHSRGPYCGSIGYIGFNKNMDTSIIIRSLVIKDQIVRFHAGGAIVADSDPASEYQETLVKAKPLQLALTDGKLKHVSSRDLIAGSKKLLS